MQPVQIGSLSIIGISVQTNNRDEMRTDHSNDETGPKLGKLWARFFDDYAPNLPQGAPVYGVYYEYDGGQDDDYRVLAGSSVEAKYCPHIIKESVTIPSGQYLVFRASGESPAMLQKAWADVWSYFAADNCPYKRSFDVDFEHYLDQVNVAIYIGIQLK